jgi:hypothetical protein
MADSDHAQAAAPHAPELGARLAEAVAAARHRPELVFVGGLALGFLVSRVIRSPGSAAPTHPAADDLARGG